jgi:hypothetical protein
MSNKNVMVEDAPAPALTPDLVSEIKKEDMMQSVFERFRGDNEGDPSHSPVDSEK